MKKKRRRRKRAKTKGDWKGRDNEATTTRLERGRSVTHIKRDGYLSVLSLSILVSHRDLLRQRKEQKKIRWRVSIVSLDGYCATPKKWEGTRNKPERQTISWRSTGHENETKLTEAPQPRNKSRAPLGSAMMPSGRWRETKDLASEAEVRK